MTKTLRNHWSDGICWGGYLFVNGWSRVGSTCATVDFILTLSPFNSILTLNMEAVSSIENWDYSMDKQKVPIQCWWPKHMFSYLSSLLFWPVNQGPELKLRKLPLTLCKSNLRKLRLCATDCFQWKMAIISNLKEIKSINQNGYNLVTRVIT